MSKTKMMHVDIAGIIALLKEEQRNTVYPTRSALQRALEGKRIRLSDEYEQRGSILNGSIMALLLIHSFCFLAGVDIFSITREEYGFMYVPLMSVILAGWLMLVWSLYIVNDTQKNYLRYLRAINFLKIYEFLIKEHVDYDPYATKILSSEGLTEDEKKRLIEAFKEYIPKE